MVSIRYLKIYSAVSHSVYFLLVHLVNGQRYFSGAGSICYKYLHIYMFSHARRGQLKFDVFSKDNIATEQFGPEKDLNIH